MYQDAIQSNIPSNVHPRLVDLPSVLHRNLLIVHEIPDPQSNVWDALDSDMLQRLSARKWVSMGLERALELPPDSLTPFLQSERATTSSFQKELNMGPSQFKLALGYIVGQNQEQGSEGKDASDVFQAGTPGVLSLEELEEKFDLGQWGLKLGQRIVKMEVKTAS